jgi:hypothetical protein
MTKALAILGIVGAVLAALFATVFTGEVVPVLVLLFLLTCAVFLFLERSTLTTVLGVAVVLLGLSALLYFNPITGANGRVYMPALPGYFRGAWMVTLAGLACIAILLGTRDGIEPAWTGWLGLAALVVAILMVPFVDFALFATALGIGVAVLVLLALFPLVALLMGGPAEVAPPTPRGTAAPSTRPARK